MRWRIKILFLGLILLSILCISCDTDSVNVEILAYNGELDDYEFQVKTIHTIQDLNKLEGTTTSLIGGTSLTFDYTTGYISWEEEGRPVAFGAVSSNDIYYPEDFNSLAMISIYYNLEQARLQFEKIGMPDELLIPMNTYYWADVTSIRYDDYGEIEKTTEKDNAFFLPISTNDKGFYVLPFDLFQLVPLSMNLGVMTHEYSHAVFDALIYERTSEANQSIEQVPYNYLYGLNEGWADFMAVCLTGDPDFMSHSIAYDIILRDASDYIKYSTVFDMAAQNQTTNEFDPYVIGAFTAALLYDATRKIDGIDHIEDAIPSQQARDYMAEVVYNTMDELGISIPNQFQLWDFFNLLLSNANESDIDSICDTLKDRYELHFDKIEGC